MKLWGERYLEAWWFPPIGRRSLDIIWGMYYDGDMHYAICLWVVHVGYRRLATEKDINI